MKDFTRMLSFLNLPIADCLLRSNRGSPFITRGIGKCQPDLIVESKVIIDTKVVDAFNENHFKQVYGYLAVTELQLGLLLNFQFAKLQWKRVIRTLSHSCPAD
jgi:PD-(D/E)XK nuclease superfamily